MVQKCIMGSSGGGGSTFDLVNPDYSNTQYMTGSAATSFGCTAKPKYILLFAVYRSGGWVGQETLYDVENDKYFGTTCVYGQASGGGAADNKTFEISNVTASGFTVTNKYSAWNSYGFQVFYYCWY